MAKINRLGWAEGFAFRSFGVSVGIRATRPGFVHSLFELLPPGSEPQEDPIVNRLYSFVVGGTDARRNVRMLNLLYTDGSRLARHKEMEPVLHSFDADMRLFVAHEARRRVFVHAGVVARNGKAILIPGRSFTGKTALVAELVRLGATYYSDEYAVLDLRGRVHPYAKPLSMRKPGDLVGRRQSVEELGGKAGSATLSVGLVVDTHYREGSRWRPREVSRGAGAMVLLANTVSARSKPGRNLPIISKAVCGARILRGVRGEAIDMAGELLSYLDLEAPDKLPSR